MKNKKGRVLPLIASLVLLLIAVIGATYAFFSVTASVTEQSLNIQAASPTGLIYNGVGLLSLENALPGDRSNVKSFTIENSSNATLSQIYNLSLHVDTNSLTSSVNPKQFIMYLGYGNCEVDETSSDPLSCDTIVEMDLTDGDDTRADGVDLPLVEGLIEPDETQVYYVYVKFVDIGENQDENKNKEFSAHIEFANSILVKNSDLPYDGLSLINKIKTTGDFIEPPALEPRSSHNIVLKFSDAVEYFQLYKSLTPEEQEEYDMRDESYPSYAGTLDTSYGNNAYIFYDVPIGIYNVYVYPIDTQYVPIDVNIETTADMYNETYTYEFTLKTTTSFNVSFEDSVFEDYIKLDSIVLQDSNRNDLDVNMILTTGTDSFGRTTYTYTPDREVPRGDYYIVFEKDGYIHPESDDEDIIYVKYCSLTIDGNYSTSVILERTSDSGQLATFYTRYAIVDIDEYIIPDSVSLVNNSTLEECPYTIGQYNTYIFSNLSKGSYKFTATYNGYPTISHNIYVSGSMYTLYLFGTDYDDEDYWYDGE